MIERDCNTQLPKDQVREVVRLDLSADDKIGAAIAVEVHEGQDTLNAEIDAVEPLPFSRCDGHRPWRRPRASSGSARK